MRRARNRNVQLVAGRERYLVLMLLCIDMQPTYSKACVCMLSRAVQYQNRFLSDRVEMIFDNMNDTREEFLDWCAEAGFAKAPARSKQFGWLRNWMDCGVSDDVIVAGLRYMTKKGATSSEGFCESDFREIILDSHGDFEDWKENYRAEWDSMRADLLFAPQVERFDELLAKCRAADSVELIGGGRNECLEEIRLTLAAFDIHATVHEGLVYW